MIALLRLIGLPLIAGLVISDFWRYAFRRNFSGHGCFFNRFADRDGYLPLWARPVYHLWIRPDRVICQTFYIKRMRERYDRDRHDRRP